MADTTQTSYFKVVGYRPFYGDTTLYVLAASLNVVERHFNSLAVEEGGLMRWSTEEIGKLPEEALQGCPKCKHTFSDPRHVINLMGETTQ